MIEANRPTPTQLAQARIETRRDRLGAVMAAVASADLNTFDLVPTVVIEGEARRPVVAAILNGETWTLSADDAAMLSIRLHLALDIRGHDRFAVAFATAVRMADRQLAALNGAAAA